MVVTYFPGRGTVFEEAYNEGRAEGEAKGRAKGKAAGVLRVLEVRGIEVSEAERERITRCEDLTRLDDWLDRAGTVGRAEELFADEPEEDGAG
ncbi:hypothetical protein [Streptomyces tagetis]|uniref:Uncharacterized protein n=1 Tax=Streptomyces tagetis TaxID=2820809 RepID=A0A940XJM1_9ACTN|nr:hypothetical protein [Streptomyces sp. RG38]MBQ0828667.1 hypothetical protein [Streptomyces sp. RG38]